MCGCVFVCGVCLWTCVCRCACEDVRVRMWCGVVCCGWWSWSLAWCRVCAWCECVCVLWCAWCGVFGDRHWNEDGESAHGERPLELSRRTKRKGLCPGQGSSITTPQTKPTNSFHFAFEISSYFYHHVSFRFSWYFFLKFKCDLLRLQESCQSTSAIWSVYGNRLSRIRPHCQDLVQNEK